MSYCRDNENIFALAENRTGRRLKPCDWKENAEEWIILRRITKVPAVKISPLTTVCAFTANRINCEHIEKLLERGRILGGYLGGHRICCKRSNFMDFIITNELLLHESVFLSFIDKRAITYWRMEIVTVDKNAGNKCKFNITSIVTKGSSAVAGPCGRGFNIKI